MKRQFEFIISKIWQLWGKEKHQAQLIKSSIRTYKDYATKSYDNALIRIRSCKVGTKDFQ